jgi:hypothetical protein
MKRLIILSVILISQVSHAYQDGDIVNRVCNEYGCVDEHGGNINDTYNTRFDTNEIEGPSTSYDGSMIETDVYSESEGW